MRAVRVMQVTVHQVIDVIAMGYGLVAAPGAVNVSGGMAGAGMLRGALVRIGGRNREDVLVHVIVVRVMHVAVVKVVHVTVVADGDVIASGTVLVRMIGVVRLGAAGHGETPREGWRGQAEGSAA